MARLPCVVFLERHFKHGGVNEQGYKALKSVIGMISEMGWETRVIFEGKIATGVSMVRMEEHIARILQVCKIFKKSMKDGLVKVEWTANGLPDLKDEKGNRLDDDELDDALTTWGNKLRVLHEPDGNDKLLFCLIFHHYDATVHRRLVELHRHKPEYRLGSLAMRSTELYYVFKELYQIPGAADELVRDLKAVYRQASYSMTKGFIPIALSSPVARSLAVPAGMQATPSSPKVTPRVKKATPASEEVGSASKQATTSSKHAKHAPKETTPSRIEPPSSAVSNQPPKEASRIESEPARAAPRKAFKLVNAMISRRTEEHVGPNLGSENTTIDPGSVPSQPHITSPVGESTTCSSDAARTSPIPQTPLRRCPTFISRDTDVQDRMIRGQVVTTRRPSVVRERGATLSEQRVEMEAWWRQPQTSSPDPQSGEPGAGPIRKNTA